MDLCKDADVLLTNFLPDARRRLRIEVEDIRKANPNIIYVRGSGHGQRGPDAEKGGYDGSTFWCRMGSAWATTPVDSPRIVNQPGGAYGDSMGGMTIAGGIAAALFARERTGETSVVDVSLMSVGAWAFALSLGNALLTGQEDPPPPLDSPMNLAVNPTIGTFKTSDGRWINFTMLQPGRYFADVCKHLGLEHLLEDPRFQTAEGLMEHANEAGAAVSDAIRLVLLHYLEEGDLARRRYALTSTVPALRDREIASVARYQRLFREFIATHMADTAEPAPLRAEILAAAVVAAHNHVLRRWLRGESPDPVTEVNQAMREVIGLFPAAAPPPAADGKGTIVVAFRAEQDLDDLIPALRRLTEP